MIPPNDTEMSSTARTPALSSRMGTAPRYTSGGAVPTAYVRARAWLRVALRAPAGRIWSTLPLPPSKPGSPCDPARANMVHVHALYRGDERRS
jgi:hypothetical protein